MSGAAMINDKAVEFFSRILNERHADLKKVSEELILELAGENVTEKKSAAQRVKDSAIYLRSILPSSEAPGWLKDLINYTQYFIEGSWNSGDLAKSHYRLLSSILNHDWGIVVGESSGLDFDGVFEFYRKESRLPELFDQIISLLQSIKDSGEIDSLNILEALSKIIATLRNGKEGSYFSLNGAWKFLMSFANNYLWAELEKVPLLGTAFEALRKTVEDADKEMKGLHSSIQLELDRRVKEEVKVFRNSAVGFLTYSRYGELLEDDGRSSTDIKA
ncbi:hypothetical protein [Pseudomonas botevensis]|uniref:hypothetical protein n=1 Tax=Pseudomonas botevensis TaxID=2842352 RepID=UPI001C3DF791|nr:hypothetical protein [Pseudomonas botevensis]MBV4476927.1 hypothetical protein [Pseudomonas botevensis]